MAFDGDEAGLAAAKRSIDLALEKGFEVRAVSLARAKDPADLILEDPNKWRELVGQAVHIIDFYLNVLKEKHGEDTRQFKLAVGKNILPYVALIQSEIDKTHWIAEVAKQIGVKEEAIMAEIKKIKQPTSPHTQSKSKPGFDSKTKKRSLLLAERLAGITLWKDNKELIPDFVRTQVLDFLENINEDQKKKLVFEAELYYNNSENLEEEIQYLAKELKKEIIKEKLENMANDIGKFETEGKSKKLKEKLSEFQHLSKELIKL
jgi:DNA primase